MPARTPIVSEGTLRGATIPTHSRLYGAIPHGDIIDTTRAELASAGLNISKEIYKSSMDYQVAQGIYHLTHSDDPEMGLMFVWANSYNKKIRFKCASGGYVFVCDNGVIDGDLANYSRKHFGKSALTDAVNSIKNQLQDAFHHYKNLIKSKEALKNILLNKRQQATLIGVMYAEKDIISLSQMGVVKRELDAPSFNYNADKDSAWALYNHVTLALKNSHPLDYINNHQMLHDLFMKELSIVTSIPSWNPGPDPDEDDADVEVAEETAASNDNSERVIIDLL